MPDRVQSHRRVPPIRQGGIRHVHHARARIHRVRQRRVAQTSGRALPVHARAVGRQTARVALVRETSRVRDDMRARRDALIAHAAAVPLPVARDQADHVRGVRVVEAVRRGQRHIARLAHHTRPVLLVELAVPARITGLQREPVLHVHTLQRGMVRHHLAVDHRDRHALARDPRSPRVPHAHVLDTPIHAIIRSQGRRRAQTRARRHRGHHRQQALQTSLQHYDPFRSQQDCV